MSGIQITETGAREISTRLENFPSALHEKLKEHITSAVGALWTGSEQAVPHRTGRLASEITERVYSEAKYRIAGYVSVYSPDPGEEYAKAGALEYGRHSLNGVLLRGNNRRAKARMAGSAQIMAFRYLRGPLERLRPEIMAGIDLAVAETVAQTDLGV